MYVCNVISPSHPMTQRSKQVGAYQIGYTGGQKRYPLLPFVSSHCVHHPYRQGRFQHSYARIGKCDSTWKETNQQVAFSRELRNYLPIWYARHSVFYMHLNRRRNDKDILWNVEEQLSGMNTFLHRFNFEHLKPIYREVSTVIPTEVSK